MTKEEADAAVAAAKDNVVEAAREEDREASLVMRQAVRELLRAESARDALDRPRLTPIADRVASFKKFFGYDEGLEDFLRGDRDHVLAEAGKLPSSLVGLINMVPVHWGTNEKTISLADLGRLIRGEG